MFGAALNLKQCLSAKFDVSLYYRIDAPYEVQVSEKCYAKGQTDNLMQADVIWINDYHGMRYFERLMNRQGYSWQQAIKHLKQRTVIFFWTGTAFMKYSTHCTEVADIVNADRFAMPELMRFDKQSKALYQPLPDTIKEYRNASKREKFTCIHTPGAKYASDKKGTSAIQRALLPSDGSFALYIVDTELHYQEALRQKSTCHAFIDQLMPNIGGIGKSGLEALMMGIPVLADLGYALASKDKRYVDTHPAIPVKENTLLPAIKKLVNDKEYYQRVSEQSIAWSEKLTYDSTLRYLLSESKLNK